MRTITIEVDDAQYPEVLAKLKTLGIGKIYDETPTPDWHLAIIEEREEDLKQGNDKVISYTDFKNALSQVNPKIKWTE